MKLLANLLELPAISFLGIFWAAVPFRRAWWGDEAIKAKKKKDRDFNNEERNFLFSEQVGQIVG